MEFENWYKSEQVSISEPQILLKPIPARDFKTACGIFKSIYQSVGSNVKNTQPAQYLLQAVTTLLVHSEQATSNSNILWGKNHNKWVSAPKRLKHDYKDQEKAASLEQGIISYKIRCMEKCSCIQTTLAYYDINLSSNIKPIFLIIAIFFL